MRKTGGEIESDVYAIISQSALKTTITGKIYKDGMRPLNSQQEDAIVAFMTGMDGQIQTGALNLNIYVQDIDNGGGQLVKNGTRSRALEIAANTIIQELKPGAYRFSLGAIIQTLPAEGTSQHFINCKIKFQLATF